MNNFENYGIIFGGIGYQRYFVSGSKFMHYLPFCCPECKHRCDAPLGSVSHGDAGIWVCPQCSRVYEIHIEFRELDLDETVREGKIIRKRNQ